LKQVAGKAKISAMIHLTLLNAFIVFLVGFAATFIGTTVGGAMLFILPVLIFVGLPPLIAIATSMFAALGANAVGLYRFHLDKKVDFTVGFIAAFFSIIGSLIGVHIIINVPKDILHKFIAILLLIILIIMIIKKAGLKEFARHTAKKAYSVSRMIIGSILFFLTGIQGGMIGGQGTFENYILMFVFGKTFLEAAGTRKIASLAAVITALIVFLYHHLVNFEFGIVLLLGRSLGAFMGASYGIKKGDEWVQKLFIIMAVIMAIKLLCH
jgi:uncharacterized membrane protein YfcA